MQTRREKLRQMALDEINTLSWQIVSENGIDALTVNGIAKRMGMTPPAFYRYYKNRGDLVKAIVMAAYASFKNALEIARDSVPEEDIPKRLFTVFMAYRQWAVNNANMFCLFAGRRVYGFDNNDPDVMSASGKIYRIFQELYLAAWEKGVLKATEPTPPMPVPYLDHIRSRFGGGPEEFPPDTVNRILSAACLVHGMISMDLSGRLSDLCGDPELFYRHQILEMLHGLGIPYRP